MLFLRKMSGVYVLPLQLEQSKGEKDSWDTRGVKVIYQSSRERRYESESENFK